MNKNTINEESLSIDTLLSGLGPAVLKSIRDPFMIIKADHSIIWMNSGMETIHKRSAEDSIGKICYTEFYNHQEPCETCVVKEVLSTGQTFITEKWQDFPDGSRRYGEVRGYPIRGNSYNISAIIIIVIDITSKKQELENQKNYSEFLTKKLSERTNEDNLQTNTLSLTTGLSIRETEVLRLMTEGYTNKQISGLLRISHHTVKSHVLSIFNKLGVNDRTQAAVAAVQHNLI